jgi:hypothetical protein
LGHKDPDPDPQVSGMDIDAAPASDADLSIIKQK